MARPHGIPVDTTSLDLGTPSPLDGVVETDHDGSRRREPVDQHQEQDAGGGQRGPVTSVQHGVVEPEIGTVAFTGGAKRRADRSTVGR